MCDNGTDVKEFFMLGLNISSNLKILIFVLLLIIYIVILIENLSIVVLVSTCHHLNVPMYIFLRNLSLADILFTTNIMPNLLDVLLKVGARISIAGCLIQYYVFGSTTLTQGLILTGMAFDRYLAICHPLRYFSIMNQKLCVHFICWPWAICFVLSPIEIAIWSQVKFCNFNIIEHFFCDYGPILAIASSDTSLVETEDFVVGFPLMFIPFVLVTASYICIFISVFKIKSIAGRWKAFSTCSAHLVTILIYFGAQISIYILPVGNNTYYEKTVKYLLYTVLTPFMNPIIYSVRNQDIKRGVLQLFQKTI